MSIRLSIPLLLAALGSAHAATLDVTSTADTVTDDGSCTLREALLAAGTNAPVDSCGAGEAAPVRDTIVLPAGTYALTDGSRGDLDLTDHVLVVGAGGGTTTIDASALEARVLHVSPGVSAELRDLTLTGGLQSGASGNDARGGGVLNEGALTLVGVRVVDNVVRGLPGAEGQGADVFGGGIASTGTLWIERSEISDNVARGGDGTTCNSSFCAPLIFDGGSGWGGGLSIEGSAYVTGSTVHGNRARYGRGGLGSNGSNLASDGGGFGGGVHVASSGELELVRSAVDGNDTLAGPANIVVGSSSHGGGLWSRGTTLVASSTIASNRVRLESAIASSAFGAGIYLRGGTMTIESSTLARNELSFHPSYLGAAIFRQGGNLSLKNSIVLDSRDPSYSLCQNVGGGSSLGGNLASPGNCGFSPPADLPSVPVADLDLGALADNGGPTRTAALGPASAALDTGLALACPDVDQRGFARVDGVCDIGAFELGAQPCSDADGDGYGSPGNAACSAGPETDCDDADPAVNPGAAEIPGNGIDDDCDASTPPPGTCTPTPETAEASVAEPGAARGLPVPVDLLLYGAMGLALVAHRRRARSG